MADSGNEFVLLFLEHYQNESILWDPKHRHYKDKKKANDAWVRLSKQLHRPIPELKKKKDSLMATFRGYLRRKRASIRSGACLEDIYKPVWFAYEYMDKFLASVYDCTTTINSQQTIVSTIKLLTKYGNLLLNYHC